MQALQWLFKAGQDQKQGKDHRCSTSGDLSSEKIKSPKAAKKPKELVSYKHKRVQKNARNHEQTDLDCRNFKYVTLLLRGGKPIRAYFSSTLNQKRLSTLNPQQHYILTMKMKKEDIARSLRIGHKADSNNAHVGNKVLPISDSTSSLPSTSSSNADDPQTCRSSNEKEDNVKKSTSNKAKTLSRMKELLRWAAAAKYSEKGGKLGRKVLHFRNKSATLKSGVLDDQNNDSPKISFRWEVESCSTTCSVASAPPSLKYDHCPRKTGSWITTDDEFVVLEL